MALKLRRGTDLQRQTITPQEGELLYTTDTKKLYVGDGSFAGGQQVAPVYSNDLIENSSALYFTKERAQDSAAALFLGSTGADNAIAVGTDNTVHTNISFVYNDSTGRLAATVPYYGTITSGQSNALAFYSATGTTISGSTKLSFDNTSNTLSADNSVIEISASNTGRSQILLTTSAAGSIGNNISFARSRGTTVTPTSVQSLDTYGSLVFNAHDGTNYLTGASLYAYNPAGFPISTGVIPTAVNLNLTDSAGVNTTRFRVLPDGRTILGPFAATEPGTGLLHIYSSVAATSFTTSNIVARGYFDSGNQQARFVRGRGTFANATAVQNGDEIYQINFYGYDGANSLKTASMVAKIDGPVTTGKVPGSLTFSTTNATTGAFNAWTKLDSNGILSHTGGFSHGGVRYISPNYATIVTSSTVSLSTSTSNNILLVGNSGLTVTLNMPATPADGQITEFIVHSNATTLALGTGTVLPTFAGSAAIGVTFRYVYRTSNTTWYKLG